MGGGKTLVKSRTYVCLLTIIFAISFVALSQNLVIAAPKRRAASSKRAAATSSKRSKTSSTSNKSKAKRAAVGGVSAKRAAVSGATSRRAATGSSRRSATGTRRRVMSRGGVKSSVVVVDSGESKGEKVEEKDICPVGVFLKREYDEDSSEYTYYSSKTKKCSLPEEDIVNVEVWEKANKSNYPKNLQNRPSWVSESEASFLACASGYVEKTLNKVKSCVSVSEICPLDEIVEKSGKVYINPNTQEECIAPEKSIVRNVKGEENLLSYTLSDENAFIFECPVNFYSVMDLTSSIKIRCEMCPLGTSSPKGATSEAECINEKEEQQKKQEKEDAKVAEEDENSRLLKLRIKKVAGREGDYTCVNGWTNNWEVSSDGGLVGPMVMDNNGVIKGIVERNEYGKNKVGCPIKLDKFYNIEGLGKTSSEFVAGYKKRLIVFNFESQEVDNESTYRGIKQSYRFYPEYFAQWLPSVGILKLKIESSELDETGVNSYTIEEFNNWGGYRPVIGYYYDISDKENLLGDRNFEACGTSKYSESLSKHRYFSYLSESISESVRRCSGCGGYCNYDFIGEKTLTNKNLFKYFD